VSGKAAVIRAFGDARQQAGHILRGSLRQWVTMKLTPSVNCWVPNLDP
jgi:hypothetical protein